MDICIDRKSYLGWLGFICRVVEREQFGARFFEPPSNGLGLRVGGPQYAPHSPIDVLKDGHRLSRVVFLDDRLRQDCAKGQNHVVVGPTVARDGDLFAKYFFGLSEASKTAVGSCQIYCGIDRLPIGAAKNTSVQRPFSGRLPGRGGAGHDWDAAGRRVCVSPAAASFSITRLVVVSPRCKWICIRIRGS